MTDVKNARGETVATFGADPALLPANVIQALARVQAEIGGIEKLNPAQRAQRGMGAGGGERGITYAYRGIDQIAAAAQPLFGAYGVVIVPELVSYEQDDVTTSGGAKMREYLALVRWHVYGPGGLTDKIEAVTVGEARDSGDKAMNKAMTAAYKNLLLRILCIGDPQDDTDNFNTSDDGEGRPVSRHPGVAAAGAIEATQDEWTEAFAALVPKQKNALIKFARDTLGVRNFSEPGELRPQMMWALQNVLAGREPGIGPSVASADPDEHEVVQPADTAPPTDEGAGAGDDSVVEPTAPASKSKTRKAVEHELECTHDWAPDQPICSMCGAEEPF